MQHYDSPFLSVDRYIESIDLYRKFTRLQVKLIDFFFVEFCSNRIRLRSREKSILSICVSCSSPLVSD